MRSDRIPIAVITVVTLGSGLVNIYSVIHPPSHHVPMLVREVFPFEFAHLSRILTVLIGFALVISAINIDKRKRRAYQLVLGLSLASIVFHLARGPHLGGAATSLVLVAILLLARSRFTVRSGIPDVWGGLTRILLMAGLAVAYGAGDSGFLIRWISALSST